MGRGTALEAQAPGLVSAAVEWVEAEALADLEPAEAARGVAPAEVVVPVRAGVCGSPLLVALGELARDREVGVLEAGVRSVRVRVEEQEQGAAQAVGAAALAVVGGQGVGAGVAPRLAGAVVPAADPVGPVRAREAAGGRQRPLLENG